MFNNSKELHKFASFSLSIIPEQIAWIDGIKPVEQFRNDLHGACTEHFTRAARLGIPENIAYALVRSHLQEQKIVITAEKLASLRNRAYKDAKVDNL